MDAILSLFGSLASGGVLGLVGGLIQKFMDANARKEEIKRELEVMRLQHDHDMESKKADREYMQEEAKNAVVLAGLQTQKELDISDRAAMAASYENDKRSYAGDTASNSKWFILVDVVRGLTRPVLTVSLDVALVALATFVCWMIWKRMPEVAQDPALLVATFNELIKALVFMSTTATMWWFAARGSAQSK